MPLSRIILSAVIGMGLFEDALATNRYVSLTGGNASPYTNWADAAANIQLAISACSSGDVVWVTNGVYDTGGVTNWPAGKSLTNRVAITTAYVTVRSANNDPKNTIIKGAWDSPATTNGPSAVRCVYMVDKTTLIGFTLTNGATQASGETDGGGVKGFSQTGHTISNCVITGNSAAGYGGGAYNAGYMFDCTLERNVAWSGGGGVNYGTLSNCLVRGNSIPWAREGGSGGAGNCTLYRCRIISNMVSDTAYSYDYGGYGGGAGYCTLYHCVLIGNVARGGGATFNCTVYNCLMTGNYAGYGGTTCGDASIVYNSTIAGNRCWWDGGGVAGGKYYCNCIVYDNMLGNNINNWSTTYGQRFTNCCTWPAQASWTVEQRNITNNPLFVANGSGYGMTNIPGDYRLSPGSPCVNAGTNYAWMTDAADPRSRNFDGQKRIQYGTVDMGAYERLNQGTVFGAR